MPKPLPAIDPLAFAARLSAALDTRPDLFPAGRGRNQAVAARYKVKPPTALAWLNGGHMPAPEKALEIADDLDQEFMPFYFGDAVGVRHKSAPGKASHPARWTADTLQDAMGFLDELDAIAGRKPAARPDAVRLAIACEVVSEGEIVDGKSVVVRLADRLRRAEDTDGNEQGKAARSGTADGGTHGDRAEARPRSSSRRAG